jgi:hypothetical protein
MGSRFSLRSTIQRRSKVMWYLYPKAGTAKTTRGEPPAHLVLENLTG